MPDKVDESNADALLELGVSLCRRAQWREAIEPLQRAAALDAAKAMVHYHLGEAYNHTDQLPEALAAYEAAASLEPEHWRALQGMGIVLDRLARPEDATAAYQRAREAQRG